MSVPAVFGIATSIVFFMWLDILQGPPLAHPVQGVICAVVATVSLLALAITVVRKRHP